MSITLAEARALAGRTPSAQQRQLLAYLEGRGLERLTANQTRVFFPAEDASAEPPSDNCVVCGRLCGTLQGITKSWRCAGRLPRVRREIEEAAKVYTFDGKRRARQLVIQRAKAQRATAVLDLWGGGQSAASFREHLPDALIVSAEMNRKWWEALRLHAYDNKYDPWCGDVAKAPGTFDFVWLDFCGQWSGVMEETLFRVARDKVRQDGTLAVTLLPARENDPFLARSRRVSVPALMVVATRLPLAYVERYSRPNGADMWLLLLGRHGQSGLDFVEVSDRLGYDGQWASPRFARMVRRPILKSA